MTRSIPDLFRRRAPCIAALLVLLAAPGGGVAAAPPSAASGSGFRIPAPTRTVLANGLTLLVLERHEIPLVQMKLLVKSGSSADPSGKGGTAALTARLLKRGTRTRPAQQFAEEVEFVGGSLEAEAGLDRTIVAGEFASRDLEVGFNLLADMVLNPAFKEEEFARGKRLAISESVSRLDDPSEVADEAFSSWLFGTHPYGRPVEGTRATLEAITRADVVSFYQTRFAPNASVLAIVGDVSAAQAAQRVTRYFGSWGKKAVPEVKLPEPVAIHGRKILIIDKPDATQTQIRFGNLAIKRNDPEYFPLLVGNTILGGSFTSWLVEEVRVKRGLTYGIRSSIVPLKTSGSMHVETFSRNAAVLETIQVALDQVRRLRTGTIPAEDLEKGRSFLAGMYPVRIESPENLASQILDIDFYGLDADYINQYPKRVRGIGADAVKRSAERFVPVDDLAIVAVGPASALKESLGTLGPVTVRALQAAVPPAS
jgi:zinc protease